MNHFPRYWVKIPKFDNYHPPINNDNPWIIGTLNDAFKNEATDELINYEKLKIQEKILFFDEVVLYEDELDDNGCTKLSVKLRVMPSGFFILQRFYLRVDKTLIRVFDTRIYHEVENNFLIREYSEREEQIEKLSVPRYSK